MVDAVPGTASEFLGAAATSDGKVVAAGFADGKGLFARISGSGLDSTFGTAGQTLVSVTGAGRYQAVAVRSTGGAVAVGTRVEDGVGDSIVGVVKANGKLDSTFGGNGKLTFNAGGSDEATAVLATSDGGFLVAGNADGGGYVARFTGAGEPDTAWDGDGRRDGLPLVARGLARRADGAVYVGGGTESDPSDWRILRLDPDGSTDATFGGSSGVTTDLGGDDVATSITLGSGGTVVATGFGHGAAGHGETVVRRYLDDGSDDTDFGEYREAFGGNDEPVAIERGADDSILVAANSTSLGDTDVVVLRLLDDGTPDPGFGIDGATLVDAGRSPRVGGLAWPAGKGPVAVGSLRRGSRTAAAAFGFQSDAATKGEPVEGLLLDAYGGLHQWASRCHRAPATVRGAPYWRGWDITRGVALLPGSRGIVVDAYGGTHTFRFGDGTKPKVSGTPYWRGWDIVRGIAVVPEGTGGYELDGFGGLHRFSIDGGPKPPRITNAPYWNGFDFARGIALMPDGEGGYVVDSTGKLYAFGGAPKPNATGARWPGRDVARGVVLTPGGSGGWVLDHRGGLHPFGTGGDQAPGKAVDGPYWSGPLARGAAALP